MAAGTAPCDLPRFSAPRKYAIDIPRFLRSFPACALLVRVLAAAWLGAGVWMWGEFWEFWEWWKVESGVSSLDVP